MTVPVFKEKVGHLWFAATSQAELDEVVALVRANEPILAQFVRLKDGPVLGYISAIDKSGVEPKIRVNQGPTWVCWSRVEYA